MAISRRIARPLLASIFIAGGVDALRNPEGKVSRAEPVVETLSERFAFIPDDPQSLIRLNGAVQVGAGGLLAIGRFRRLAALVLIGSIIPTTYAGHRFWEETDETVRAQQRMQFFKNLGLLGGLILAAVDTEGDPSLGWRARSRGRQLEAAVTLGRAATTSKAHRTASKAAKVGRRETRRARNVGRSAQVHAVDVFHQAAGSDAAHQVGEFAATLAAQAGSTGTDVVRQLKPVAATLAAQAGTTGAEVVRQLKPVAATLAAQAGSTGAEVVRQLKPAMVAAAATGVDAAKPLLASGADLANEAIGAIGAHVSSR